jgi:8-oxo-dGTP diphosphatase
MNTPYTKISIGILVFKDNNILFGKTNDKYILPVGHLEYMESFKECAKREIKEECGIEIEDIRFQYISNTDNYKPKHYIHIGLIAKWKSGEPQVFETGAIEEWEWIDRSNTPKNLSIGTELTLKALEENKTMYDMVSS